MGLFEKMKVNPPATVLPAAVAAPQAPQAAAQPAFSFGNAATKKAEPPKAEPPPAVAVVAPSAAAEGLTPEMLAQGVTYLCTTFARALRAAADVLDEG
jgi:hypothetical protein